MTRNNLCRWIGGHKCAAIWATGAVLMMGLVFWFWSNWISILSHRKQEIETQAVGELLLLFVDHHGRMPEDMEELYERKYLVVNERGYPQPGPATYDRASGYGPPARISLQYLDRMGIGFASAGRGRPALRVRGNESADCLARKYSLMIARILQEAASQPGARD